MIIKHEHLKLVKYCSKTSREFCIIHGIDWMTFVRYGVDEKVLLDTRDDQARKLVEAAKSHEVNNGR